MAYPHLTIQGYKNLSNEKRIVVIDWQNYPILILNSFAMETYAAYVHCSHVFQSIHQKTVIYSKENLPKKDLYSCSKLLSLIQFNINNLFFIVIQGGHELMEIQEKQKYKTIPPHKH